MKDDKTKKPLTDEQLDEANGGFIFELLDKFGPPAMLCGSCRKIWFTSKPEGTPCSRCGSTSTYRPV
jgi:hypothetical protein